MKENVLRRVCLGAGVLAMLGSCSGFGTRAMKDGDAFMTVSQAMYQVSVKLLAEVYIVSATVAVTYYDSSNAVVSQDQATKKDIASGDTEEFDFTVSWELTYVISHFEVKATGTVRP